MERVKTALIVLLAALCAWLAVRLENTQERVCGSDTVARDTVVVERIDTIAAYRPAPKDSAEVRHVKIPAKTQIGKPIGEGPAQKAQISLGSTDSIEIPITSKHYADTLYEAWVSGYEATLDSIRVYGRTETMVVSERLSPQTRRGRWGLSIGAGLAVGAGGKVEPGVFIGASYTLWQW